ncbi:polyprenyl synthetase family protein [Bifidobacterium sp. ESL0763]|uniref:polyprenyl synthetase family protein n=1 Tax=Bifidobacterium sp. ESL0763 TaxID=2983227 RepID=UPI0023F7012D|nr:polyprenyl synthetase family protein [Bifidobacterium sp. ESL0763]MDF7664069.1 polyprenyl synthetase family protein [Bifidobacterium sp. ESL0763]
MSTSVDNRTIDRRIEELTNAWMATGEPGCVDAALEPTMRALRGQAAASNAGGKRLRARLALAAYGTGISVAPIAAEQPAQAHGAMLDLACAIEIHQTSALIHDDLIDDSPLRRGRPSAHAALGEATGSESSGNGLALMLGNMLATAAASIAVNALTGHGLANPGAGISAFLAMQRAIEIGQSLDLAAEGLPLEEPERLASASLNVFAWKTASYTTIAPIMLGLAASGVDPDHAKAAARAIGLPLGVAFQLADDLLDVTGDPARTGKPVGGDIREGKRTVLLADALMRADEPERRTLIAMYQAPRRGDDEVREALALFASTGAIDASRKRIRSLWNRADKAIDTAIADASGRATLRRACLAFVPGSLR